MSDFTKGLWLALLAACAASAVSMFLPRSTPPFHPETVTCFPIPNTAGLFPAVKSQLPPRNNEEDKIDRYRQDLEASIAAAKVAQQSCSPQSCSRDDFKAYRHTILKYLFEREHISQSLYRDNGEDGLAIAAGLFFSQGNVDVVAHLKSMFLAGKIKFTDLGGKKQSAALLVLKGAEKYRPCVPQKIAGSD